MIFVVGRKQRVFGEHDLLLFEPAPTSRTGCFSVLNRADRCRTIESLYEELVTEGIIIRPQRLNLNDFEGEYRYLEPLLCTRDKPNVCLQLSRNYVASSRH